MRAACELHACCPRRARTSAPPAPTVAGERYYYTISVTPVVYIMALVAFIGWFLLVLFGGCARAAPRERAFRAARAQAFSVRTTGVSGEWATAATRWIERDWSSYEGEREFGVARSAGAGSFCLPRSLGVLASQRLAFPGVSRRFQS
eukprot:2449544-Pleurochrysis_carterae.AAC.1